MPLHFCEKLRNTLGLRKQNKKYASAFWLTCAFSLPTHKEDALSAQTHIECSVNQVSVFDRDAQSKAETSPQICWVRQRALFVLSCKRMTSHAKDNIAFT